MGYVPSRKYDNVSAVLGPGGLRIKLPAEMEDIWFFENLWLKGNAWAKVQRLQGDQEGCLLSVSAQKASYRKATINLENLTVNITAQGLVQIGCVDHDSVPYLQKAIGQEVGGQTCLLNLE